MRLIFHDDAFADIRDAVEFYATDSVRAAERLKVAIKNSLASIVSDAGRFPIVEGEVQRCRVKGFPFDLYFTQMTGYARIHALLHHSRDPEQWKSRVGS